MSIFDALNPIRALADIANSIISRFVTDPKDKIALAEQVIFVVPRHESPFGLALFAQAWGIGSWRLGIGDWIARLSIPVPGGHRSGSNGARAGSRTPCRTSGARSAAVAGARVTPSMVCPAAT